LRPSAPSSRRRRIAAAAILVALGALVLAPAAFGSAFVPESGGSPNADSIRTLYELILYIALAVFAIVEGALLYSLLRFRARRDRAAAQIHGNTRLELSWTFAAALILVVLAVVTFVKLGSIQNPPNGASGGLALGPGVLTASTSAPTPPNGKKLTICVTGRQYIWRYTYGAGCTSNAFGLPYSYVDMYVPAGTVVVLAIQSTDVNHSWWIPKLGGKFDAIPGYTSYTWFKAPRAGAVYRGQCAQLCGRNHADMVAAVHVLSADAYRGWLTAQKARIQTADQQAEQIHQQLSSQGNL
jgi:cytochrome c oxidase subunit 2